MAIESNTSTTNICSLGIITTILNNTTVIYASQISLEPVPSY